jgi:hypothetical protein
MSVEYSQGLGVQQVWQRTAGQICKQGLGSMPTYWAQGVGKHTANLSVRQRSVLCLKDRPELNAECCKLGQGSGKHSFEKLRYAWWVWRKKGPFLSLLLKEQLK